jgi:REP element-mobilizing transposase RayT
MNKENRQLPLMHRGHLPRLARQFYQGWAFVHWSLSIKNRAIGWLSPVFHAGFREVMAHAQARYEFICPAYCLMPDHVHMLWVGLGQSSDQWLGMNFLRRHTRPMLKPYAWQSQAYDNVLQEKDRQRNAFEAAAHYIIENPVRKLLVERPEDYPFSGAVVLGYPSLNVHERDYWDTFWKIDAKLRSPL